MQVEPKHELFDSPFGDIAGGSSLYIRDAVKYDGKKTSFAAVKVIYYTDKRAKVSIDIDKNFTAPILNLILEEVRSFNLQVFTNEQKILGKYNPKNEIDVEGLPDQQI